MKIEVNLARRLFIEGLKVGTAERWDDKTLAQKCQRLKKYKEPDLVIEDEELSKLYDAAVAALDKSEPIELDGADLTNGKPVATAPDATPPAEEKPAKKQPKEKPAAKGKDKPPAKKQAEETEGEKRKAPAWADLTAKWKKEPQQYTDRGDGVVKFIRDQLIRAGENDTGITKEQLHQKMIKKFPNRDANKMLTTLKNQVPTRLRIVRGIHVWKHENGGYYIPTDGGKKPQPEPKKPKAAAKGKEEPPAKKPAAKKKAVATA